MGFTISSISIIEMAAIYISEIEQLSCKFSTFSELCKDKAKNRIGKKDY